MKEFIKTHKHAAFFLYLLIYLPWFMLLEKHVVTDYNIIHIPFDDKIPFIEYFIVPYLLWFPYVGFAYVYFFFKDKQTFIKMATFLTIGMTFFLILCSIYPNGLPANYRPDFDTLGRDNIFIDLVKTLYSSDTSTNVLPSIHVFNSLGVHIAFMKHKDFKYPKLIKGASLVLCTLICFATVCLKQHSILDVIAAFALAAVLYPLIFMRKKKI
ncbi:MAG: phosphatase PAP2 family protein [Lachnospiraceae bacterium]|nr:phosphoesterase [Lachnospira sp.]MBR6697602.1 phosphatase PAP2 family protein [Lachnospiraceae bacterium]